MGTRFVAFFFGTLLTGACLELIGGRLIYNALALLNFFGSCLVMTAVILYHEISRSAIYRRLRQDAETDILTSLLNLRGFRKRYDAETTAAQHTGKALSLLLIDIDYFKKINDEYGHEAGDRAIRHIAQLLRSSTRISDAVGRLGGEEFAILLPGADKQRAAKVADKLRRLVADTPLFFNETSIAMTISLGVAERAEGADDFYGLFSMTDRRLYTAKVSGRNRVETT